MDFYAAEKKWIKRNILDSSILAVWAIIALAASANWIGLCFMVLAVPILKAFVVKERFEAWHDGYAHATRYKPVVVNKVKPNKDLTEKQNEEAYW